jgi:hypothetical protein
VGLALCVSACETGPAEAPAPGILETLVGAGDIAKCGDDGDEATARLLDSISGTVFTAGDNAYSNGSAGEFADCYDPSWGRHKSRTRPSPGNHDYRTPGAAGYFAYFGANAGDPNRGYYSYELGVWHVLALNSNIDMSPHSPQLEWLTADLSASSMLCTVAYWHHPRFSSGTHGNDPSVADLWEVLYAAGVDVIINGHDHDYERFAPQTPAGDLDRSRGIRQFVVGTGGASLRDFDAIASHSEVRISRAFGVLKLTLRATAYEWEFVTDDGQVGDMGGSLCH